MLKPTLFDYIQRYGLLVLAAASLLLLLLYPPIRFYLRYASVLFMLVSIFNGRAFIRDEDARGWMLQNAALLMHAAVLIANGVMT